MKLMKRVVWMMAVMIFALGPMALSIEAAEGVNSQSKCPVMGGPINKSVYIDQDGKRIYFCCEACTHDFRKDPAKYMKKLEEEGVALEAASAN